MLTATFYGVRGSTPCSCTGTSGYGGNTSCVLVESGDGKTPIVLDMGTGLRYLGRDMVMARAEVGENEFELMAMVSHLHWDHIQGIPFFAPMFDPNFSLRLVGPQQPGSDLRSEFEKCVRPPVFPIAMQDFPANVDFIETHDETLTIGDVTVRSFAVPHVGPTNGYRLEAGGASLVYVSDHQQPSDGSLDIPHHVVEACRGAHTLIHDSQFDEAEQAERPTWGHCTGRFALELAKQAGVRRLVLFHHDPAHDDAWVKRMGDELAEVAGDTVEVVTAYEGLTFSCG